jgi:membrane protein DedA with SNARE-associated domain
MNQLVRAIRATYNFFAGDAIILTAVVVAFIAGAVLQSVAHLANVPLAVVFVGVIVLGLVLTLARELRGRPRSG